MADGDQTLQLQEYQPEAQGGLDAGTVLVAWETWDRVPVQRTQRWYLIAAAVGILMIVYGVLTANYLFVLVMLMFGVLMMLDDMRKPRRVYAYLTTLGVVYDEEFFPYEAIKDFSVMYQPPAKHLYVGFVSRVQPMLSIPLEDADPSEVRDTLLQFAMENLDRNDESLTDILHRVYKI